MFDETTAERVRARRAARVARGRALSAMALASFGPRVEDMADDIAAGTASMGPEGCPECGWSRAGRCADGALVCTDCGYALEPPPAAEFLAGHRDRARGYWETDAAILFEGRD